MHLIAIAFFSPFDARHILYRDLIRGKWFAFCEFLKIKMYLLIINYCIT